MVRDRLEEFRLKAEIMENGDPKYRTPTSTQGISCSSKTTSENKSVLIDMPTTGPNLNPIFQQVGVINKLIKDLRANIEKLKKIHSEILSTPTFEDETKNELDNLMSAIKNTSMIIQVNLKVLKVPIDEGDEDESLNPEKIRSTQHAVLLHTFYDVINDYHNAQTEYTARCKARIRRQSNIMGIELSEQDVEKMIIEGKWPDYADGLLASSKDKDCELKLDAVKKRHETFIRLENSLKEVHDLFSEIAFFVESQGIIIDSIAKNVADTRINVGKGGKDLKKAVIPAKNRRKRRVYIAAAFSLLLVLLCFIIYRFIR